MRDLRQTLKYAEYMKTLGWKVALVSNESRQRRGSLEAAGIRNHVYIKKIPLVGNIAKLQRPSAMPAPEVMESLHRKYTLAAIYIEPLIHNSSFLIPGLKPAKNCFLPPKTIQIDLSQSLEQLVSQMKKETRYSLKLAERFGVRVEESRDIEAFIKLWHQSARRRGFFFSQGKEIKALWSAFGKKAHLLLAFSDPKQPLAGVLIARSPTAAYYMYAVSTREGNKLATPTLLVWEAVKLAKKAGCKIFDFEGINDPRYPQTKSWKGFSRFKEGFGGKAIEYPRTLVKYYNPLLRVLQL